MTPLEILIEAHDKASAELARIRSAIAQMPQATGPAAAGMNQAAAATANFEEQVATLSVALPVLGKAVALNLTIITTAVTALLIETRRLADASQELENFKQQTGLSIHQLQGLQLMMREASVPAGALSVGLDRLQRAIEANDPALASLGATAKEVWPVLMQLSQRFSETEDGARKSAFAQRLFGEGGRAWIPVLNQGAEALAGAGQKALDMGVAFGSAHDDLLAANAQITELGTRVEGLKTTITLMAVPAIVQWLDNLNRLLEALREIPEKIANMRREFEKLIEAIPGGKQLLQFLALGAAVERMNKALAELKGNTKGGFVSFEDLDKANENVKDAEKGTLPTLPPRRQAAERKAVEFAPGSAAGIAAFLEQKFKADQKAWEEALSKFVFLPGGGFIKLPGHGPITRQQTEQDQIRAVLQDAQSAMLQIQDLSNIVQSGIQSGYAALATSTSQILEALVLRTATFKTVMLNLFKSMVQVILDELAKILASAVWNALISIGLKILGGIALSGATLGAGGAMPVGPIGFGPLVTPPGGGVELGTGGGVTNVFINAMDEKSINDHFRGALGAFSLHAYRNENRRSV